MKEFIDKTDVQAGTPINRASMMAIQGFQRRNINFYEGYIEEINSDGAILRTTFKPDGSIEQKFIGEKTITKTTSFDEGGIVEDIS